MNNEAFIDAQNLRLGTFKSENPWTVDLRKLRIYLNRKYKVNKAYYFLGYRIHKLEKMYDAIQSYGYDLIFKETIPNTISSKKGNVDTDIVFEMMKSFVTEENFDKIILVSGDGDYYKTVRFLIEKEKFGKILGPNEKYMSALYTKKLSPKFYSFLSRESIQKKIKL